MSGKRVECVDCARALCMLFIVGIYHLNDYLKNPVFAKGGLTTLLVTTALATFTFISGYFLGKKHISCKKDALDFYCGRFIRLYPLFFVSSCSLYAASIVLSGFSSSFGQLILTLLGAACYAGKSPLTVWYVSMLLSFYLITPLILGIPKRKLRIAAAGSIYAALIVLKYTGILPMDYRIILYYPLYFTGLIVAESLEIDEKNNLIAAAASAAILIGLFLIRRTMIRDIAAAFFGTVLIIELGKLCARTRYLKKLLLIIGRASMMAYLFHRQIFGACQLIIGEFPRLLAGLVILPACIALCYAAQSIYDRLCVKLFRPKRES